MAAITVNSKFLTLSCNDVTFVSFSDGSDIVKLKIQVPKESNQKNVEETERQVVCSSISPCGSLFVVSMNKYMSIWKTSDWSVVSNQTLARTASQIIFTPKSESLIVADKSGDVYKYNVPIADEPVLLLGHLSVILDVVVTPDERFIITCDRDEKIRVSLYPKSYNIHCFCLGHEEFVTSINLLPHDEKILLSGSGDGTLRMWNYDQGKQILKYSCATDLKQEDLNIDTCPILCVKCVKLEEKNSLIFVGAGNFKGVLIYLMRDSEQTFVFSLKQILKTSAEPCAMAIHKENLWLLFREKKEFLNSYSWSETEGCFKISDNFALNLHKMDMISDILEESFKKDQTLNQLYKKKFDNVKDYFERKQARLEGTKEPKQKKIKVTSDSVEN